MNFINIEMPPKLTAEQIAIFEKSRLARAMKFIDKHKKKPEKKTKNKK